MRVVVRVYPNARLTSVGGRYGDGEPAVLVVRVQAPAVDGLANNAVIAALANALDVAKRDVRIVAGHTSRTKTLDVAGVTAADVENLLAR